MLIWSLLILIFIFLQATFLPLDVVTVLVLWALLVWPARKAWLLVMLAGIISDLIYGRTVGESSIWYLVVGLGLWVYGQRYSAVHAGFLGVAVFIVTLLSNWRLMGQWMWWWALGVSVVAVASRRLLVEWQWGGRLRV